jgi:NADH dehydrogenase
VAEGFERALGLDATVKQTYDVGGPDAVSMEELVDLVGAALGRRHPLKLHVPVGVMRPLARLFHRMPAFPVTPDQLAMLEADNTCDPRPFYTTFKLTPIPLAQGLASLFG